MPLFMCLSRYDARNNKGKTFKRLFRRVSSLLLPFITFAVIDFFIYKKSIIHTFLYPENGLWFFWVLSVIEVLIYLVDTTANKFNGGGDYLLLNLVLLCVPSNYLD